MNRDSANLSSNLRRIWFAGAVVAFIVTRLWLLFWFEPLLNGDVKIYLEYAVKGIDLSQQPYHDLPLEYPPLAWWTIAAPRYWPTQVFYLSYLRLPEADIRDFIREYFGRFRLMMAGFDTACFALLLAIVYRRRRELLATTAWGYVLATALLPHLLYDRLDVGLLFFMLLWAWSLSRSIGSRWPVFWRTLGYAALGLGISYKLIPLVIVPACAVSDFRRAWERRQWGGLLLELTALSVTALGPFVYYYAASGEGIFDLFRFHGGRGLQIETVYASLLMPLRAFGMEMSTPHESGSINLATPISSLLATFSSGLLAALLISVSIASWRTAKGDDGTASYRLGLVTLLVAVVVSKVLSVQYMIWTLPFLLLLGTEVLSPRSFRWLTITSVVVAGLSTLIYPYLFLPGTPWFTWSGELITNEWPLASDRLTTGKDPLNWIPCAILFVRNALLLSAVVAIVAATLRRGICSALTLEQ